MSEKVFKNIEYVSGAFKGLSPGKQDHILDIARSLLEVQDESVPDTSETSVYLRNSERPSSALKIKTTNPNPYSGK